MPGPAPKFEPARRNTRTGPIQLPAEGRKGKPPAWPLASTWEDAGKRRYEARVWRDLWASPQAVAWDRMGPATTREVARYCRLLVDLEFGAEDKPAALHGQATALADRLGLTPKAMRLLLWEIVADQVGEQRQAGTSARDRMKAL